MQIKELTGERAWRTYTGGKLLDILHKKENSSDSHYPEEWMFSTTIARNSGREDIVEGLSYLKNENKLFVDFIKENPKVLGEKHIQKWGVNLGVLVKLIDSEERLTIQVHPNNQKAKELFNSKFGKTESWHILDTREEKSYIYLGFKEGISKEKFKEYFIEQDLNAMLNCLNKIEVKKGETYLVKGGVPHAIGAGCLILEVQEPTDYTIRVEKTTPSGFVIDDKMCHQGLGFERMFECFDFIDYSEKEIRNNFQMKETEISFEDGRKVNEIITYKDTSCFSLMRLMINNKIKIEKNETYTCLYVISGIGKIEDDLQEIKLEKNVQIFIPANKEFNILGEKLNILLIKGPNVK
ncbi:MULTISPECIES: type I phosphomannose isomerase catalytic subunit [Fusobacterium]|uniref:type I phosphomannose isomerase catalytic subunit n=1 Tax=Fusobacterium TaxID=848 RepID=UPI001476B013|nr:MULTISPECIES: type I phosphomannose isomerase catalytic subunit [Fusobacterium]NME35521.1 mannose-6-phosphate isomerase [Fusobacterium sp. FSA-380-WT-3A]